MNLPRPKQVVLVCMVDSIHVARWISQFTPDEVEFTLFPATPNRRVHSKIKDMIQKNGNIKIVPFEGKFSIPLWGLDLIFSDYIRGLLLRSIIKREKPNFVHALELQHGGYITSRSLEDPSITTSFIATNYGSDIYWFQQFPSHLRKIKKLLARADRYSAECIRDVNLAWEYGFKGEVMPVIPNSGIFEKSVLERETEPTSSRTTIAVKGYDGWAGRSIIALRALRLLEKEVKGFNIVVYSAPLKIIFFCWILRTFSDLKIRAIPKNSYSHKQMIDLFSKTKIYIGLSRTDGISTSFLESTIMGSFPIQTSTSCAGEWIENGEGGMLVDQVTVQNLVSTIRNALKNPMLDTAMDINSSKFRNRFDSKKFNRNVRQFYDIN